MNTADLAYALDTYCIFQKNFPIIANRSAYPSTDMDRTCKPPKSTERGRAASVNPMHRERNSHGKIRR